MATGALAQDMQIIADFSNSMTCPTPMFSAAVLLFNAAVASGYGRTGHSSRLAPS